MQKVFYNDGTNVRELVDRYISTKTGVTHNTKAGYKTVQNMLEKENFGNLRIDKVKFSDAKLFLIGLQKAGRSYQFYPFSSWSVTPAFQMALEDGMIQYNPFNFELAKVLINVVYREKRYRQNRKEIS